MTTRIELFSDVDEVLKQLKSLGMLMVIVTNAPKVIVEKIVNEKPSLKNAFDHILTFDDVKKGKPDPEMVYKALTLINLSPSETCFVGDSLNSDGGASKAANVPFILIDRNMKEHLIIADAILLGDPIKAENAMREHIQSNMADLLEVKNYNLIFKT